MKRSSNHRSIHRNQYSALSRFPLAVCATLVQNPANLAGLCRTCEVFRLEALVLADLDVTQTSAFRAMAASAHHWQPLQICSTDRLSSWLLEQKQAGYALIALQASAEAQDLTQFRFPLRSVLVLGQELTGIPTEISVLCDSTVSIPQFGLVESLNVQTAGSIAIYEYMKQWQNSL